jgi:hypothetical protein
VAIKLPRAADASLKSKPGDILQLIYASAAATVFTKDDLQTLLLRARKKNHAAGISGMLVYDQGSFLQVLEGPLSAVTEVYAAIAADRRHKNLNILFKDTIDAKEFEEWAMGFADPQSSARALEGFLDYRTQLKSRTLDKTRAKKVLRMFQDGAWRQAVTQ